ncbi:MAG: 4Fe-4S binding protein [Oscillospiraceae bacterium]|nr:4Fe-4S binding protein [Oscillospiraceae bacterium]
MIRDYAKKYYLEQDYNCAESVFLAAGEALGLGLTDRDAKLIGGFGGGIGCGSVCGALAGAVAVLGAVRIGTRAHATEGFKEECAALKAAFEARLGGVLCAEVKPRYAVPEQRCFAAVQLACDVLEAQLRPAGEEPISAAEIKRVKGLGFLQQKGTRKFNGRILTRNGKISAAEGRAIAEAAEKFGAGEVAMTTRLTLEVQGIPYENIESFRACIAQAGLETGGTGSKVRPVVSCKGTTCQYGLCDTFALSRQLHETFYQGWHDVLLPHKFKIAVGGCPNNCVKPDLNDFGVVGQRVPQFDAGACRGCKKCAVEKNCPIGAAKLRDGRLVIDTDACNHCGRCVGRCPFHALEDGRYGYRVYIGGRWGKHVAQGQALRTIFTSPEAVTAVLEKALLLFRDQGITGERFSDTIDRLGFENVEAQLLDDALLARRDEILQAEKHLVGGATC